MGSRPSRTRDRRGPAVRARLDEYRAHLQSHQPGLLVEARSGEARFTGVIGVNVGAAVRVDYSIEVAFPGGDPFVFPDVWDRGDHFAPDAYRHVENWGPRGWRWCLGLPQAPPVDFEAPAPLPPFLDIVEGFILKQRIYDDRRRRGHPHPWPGPEWAHGMAGHVEWVREQLPGLDGRALRRLMPYLLDAPLAGNRRCPCGSGKKAADCHRDIATTIRSFSHVEGLRTALKTIARDSHAS